MPLAAPLLISGFGPFLDVEKNPTERLARELDGTLLAGVPVVGIVLPVSYERGVEALLDRARALEPVAVLGFGVARRRSRLEVERFGYRDCGDSPDIDGCRPSSNGEGPDRVRATLDLERLALALDAGISDDPGRYVCNAWAYRVPQRCAAPAAFIHVPPSGISVEAVREGLERWLTRLRRTEAP